MLDARCTTHADAEAEGTCTRCGDFVCRLCGPLEPVALCPRCALKTTLEWEDRGEHGVARAFFATLREAVSSPSSVGARLGGAGNAPMALAFVTTCALSGLVPLGLVLAVPFVALADPARLGLRSTEALSLAAFLVLLAVSLATLLAAGAALGALVLWGLARVLGVSVRYELLVRATSYGLGIVSVPVLGPLLTPVALVQSMLSVHAALAGRAGRRRASFVLAAAAFVALGIAAVPLSYLVRRSAGG